MPLLIILILIFVILPICFILDQYFKNKKSDKEKQKKYLELQKDKIYLEIAKEKLKEIKKKNADH